MIARVSIAALESFFFANVCKLINLAKFDEVHDNSEDYIYEYISSTEWNDNNPEEVYFKVSKRQVSYDN